MKTVSGSSYQLLPGLIYGLSLIVLLLALLMLLHLSFLNNSYRFHNNKTMNEQLFVWLYLRKLSCWRGRGEGVGHHGAEYIQVVVVLAYACATIVSWYSCRCIYSREVKELVLQVEYKSVRQEEKQPCGLVLREYIISHEWFPNYILPGFTENSWKIIQFLYNKKLL